MQQTERKPLFDLGQLVATPGTVKTGLSIPAQPTMANPPSGVATQFTMQGSITGCGAAPSGNYYFTPAVVYSFNPPQTNPATGLINVPGQILRNGQPWLGGGTADTSASVQDSFFSIYDFQIRSLFTLQSGATQKWAPTDATFCSLTKASNPAGAYSLTLVEIKIVYTISEGLSQPAALKTVTRLIRVNPRSLAFSPY